MDIYQNCMEKTDGFSPSELVYGKNQLFPIEFELKTLITTLQVNLDMTIAQKHRLNHINELDGKNLVAIYQAYTIQQKRAKWHENFIKKNVFQKGNWALLYMIQGLQKGSFAPSGQGLTRQIQPNQLPQTMPMFHCFPMGIVFSYTIKLPQTIHLFTLSQDLISNLWKQRKILLCCQILKIQ